MVSGGVKKKDKLSQGLKFYVYHFRNKKLNKNFGAPKNTGKCLNWWWW